MSPTEAELLTSAYVNHAEATKYLKRLGGDVQGLAALYAADHPAPPPVEPEPPVVEPPVVVEPPTKPPSPATGDYGCDLPPHELTLWTAAQDKTGGRPDAIAKWGDGAVLAGFRYDVPTDADGKVLYAHRGISNEAGPQTRRVVVQDFVQPRYNKWGMRLDGAQQLLIQRGTVSNDLYTGQDLEHGAYVGLEGWAPGMPHAYEDFRDSRFRAPTVDGLDVSADPFAEFASLIFRDMAYIDNTRNSIQQVQRDYHKGSQDAVNPETFDSDMGPIVLEYVLMRNSNHTPQSGFALSLFAPQWWGAGPGTPNHNGMRRASQGVIALGWTAHSENADGAGHIDGKKYVALVGGDCIAERWLNRPLLQIRRTDGQVILRDRGFYTEGGQDVVTVDGFGALLVQNCRGNARLVVNGSDMGTFDQIKDKEF